MSKILITRLIHEYIDSDLSSSRRLVATVTVCSSHFDTHIGVFSRSSSEIVSASKLLLEKKNENYFHFVALGRSKTYI